MKDLVIPARFIRREILVLAFCILLALLVNAVAIIAYKTRWIELLTTWRTTLALALGIYVLLIVPRLGAVGLRQFFGRPER